MSNLIHKEIEAVLDLSKKGASVRTIAAQTGISKSTVSRILRGERVCDMKENGNGTNGTEN